MTAILSVLSPIPITDALLISSTAPETDYTAWSGTMAYAAGTRVILAATHKIYESLQGASAIVTMTIAVPGVITWAAHGKLIGTPIQFSTTGALPTGLVAGTTYYITPVSVDTFTVSATAGGAAIATTGTQSGVHTAIASTNINKTPATYTTGTTPFWLEISPTNKWAMFDGEISTQTVIASPLTVVIRPGNFNAIYLAGLSAETITITCKDAPGGNVIYSYTGALEGSQPPDYYEHFFDAFQPKTDFIHSGIGAYAAAEITLTLSSGSGSVYCGVLALGDLRPLGSTLSGATARPKTYSSIKVDEFGKNKIVRRKSAKDMSAKATVDIAEADSVLQTITELLDIPCVWVASESSGYSGLRVFGLGSADMSYDNARFANLSLNVQGLI